MQDDLRAKGERVTWAADPQKREWEVLGDSPDRPGRVSIGIFTREKAAGARVIRDVDPEAIRRVVEAPSIRAEVERRIEREKINLGRALREMKQARNEAASARAEIKRLKGFLVRGTR